MAVNTLRVPTARAAGLELSYQLAGRPTRQDYLRAAGAVLLALLPGDMLAWNAVDARAGAVEVIPHPEAGWDPDELAQRLLAVADDHPIVLSYLRDDHGDGSPRRLSDVATRSNLLRTRAYAELLRPLGGEHQLAILSGRASPQSAHWWAINRARTDFTDAEVDLARAVQPALSLLDVSAAGGRDPSEAQWEVALRYGLTARELEVLRALSDGLTVTAMARQLRISSRTIRKHLENAYRKLDCHDRLMAVTTARAAGLV